MKKREWVFKSVPIPKQYEHLYYYPKKRRFKMRELFLLTMAFFAFIVMVLVHKF